MHSMTDSLDTHIERVLSKKAGKRKRAHIQYGGDEMKDSHTCTFWAKHWGWKGYRAHFFIEQAKKICKDSGNNTHASIAKLASSSSSFKNHSRGFRRAVNKCGSGPKVSFVSTVVIDTKHPSGVAKEIPYEFPVIYPHDHLSWLHKNFPDLVEMFLTGGKSEQQLQHFWDRVSLETTPYGLTKEYITAWT